jgi:hypothetical protein
MSRRRTLDHWLPTCTAAERDAIAWAVRTFHARRSRQAAAIARGDAPLPSLAFWISEVERQEDEMRPANPAYRRFDAFARTLTVEVIRAATDAEALARIGQRLRGARSAWAERHLLHGLSRVGWSRAELGVLITEATNRGRQLAAGDPQRAKGPPLDPARLPDDRLEILIQRHRDLAVVEALRAERARRAQARRLAA